jgi:hypothetical protein
VNEAKEEVLAPLMSRRGGHDVQPAAVITDANAAAAIEILKHLFVLLPLDTVEREDGLFRKAVHNFPYVVLDRHAGIIRSG